MSNINQYTYDALYETSMNNYNNLLKQLETITKSEIYENAIYDMPFALLRTLYLANRIEIYSEAPENKKPAFRFDSIQEALATYRDIIQYKSNLNSLLNTSSLILEADKLTDKINTYVRLSDYLNDSLLIKKQYNITKLAKECIDTLPKCKDSITKELINSLVKDMVNQFDEKYIKILLDKKIINEKNYNYLSKIDGSEKFKKNISFISNYLGLSEKLLFSQEFRLKGVTYKNEDGTDRQTILKELQEKAATNPDIKLQLQPFVYTPKLGNPEPAVAVLWEGKELGYLPKEISNQLHNEYKDNSSEIQFMKVLGGSSKEEQERDIKYGICVKLSIYEITKESNKTNEIEKQEVEKA